MRLKTYLIPLLTFVLTALTLTLSGGNLLGQTSWYQKGREATNNHDKVDYFTRSLQEEGPNKFTYYLRAWAQYDLGRFEKSIRDFTTSLTQEEGELPDTYNQTGISWCHYRMGDYESSMLFADKAIQGMNNNAEAWNVKGWCSISLEKDNQAITAFTKYISIKPEVALGYSNRSYAFSRTSQFQKTIDDCDKVLSIDPENYLVLERKAYAMLKLGQKDEAINLVKDRIEYKEGEDPKSVSMVGNLFYRNEDYPTAISYHTEAIRIYNDKVKEDKDYRKVFREDIYDIYMNRGESHYALKDYQRALADLKKATVIKDADYRAWERIGQLQTYQENWSEGAQAYERAFEIRPELKEGWVNLGFCYDRLNQPDRAIVAYSRGIKNNPNTGLLYNNRGYGYLLMKQYDKALKDLEKAIEVQPAIVMSHVSLGEYYFYVEQYDKAIEIFNKAITMEDGSEQAYTAAYFTRGSCFYAQEKFELAKLDYLKAIGITSDHVEAHEKLGMSYFELEEFCLAYKTLKKTLDLEKTIPFDKKKAKDAPRYLGKMTKNPCL